MGIESLNLLFYLHRIKFSDNTYKMAEPQPSSSISNSTAASRMAERMQKLKSLHAKRTESRQINHSEVIEEDRRAKEPKNMEARKRRAEYLLQEEEFKRKCEAEGKDFEREKMRRKGADEAEWSDRQKKNKQNPDQGFSTYEEASFRKYNQLVKQIKPNMEEYKDKKERAGDAAFYAAEGAIVHGTHKDTPDALDRLAKDTQAQIDKREKYSRRRMHDDDADIDYINERNMKFNQKLERFYGKYTKEIKDNLERGTAV